MTRNEGNIDRIVRIVLLFSHLASRSIHAGIVPLATGLIGWCPLYAVFGLSTCPVKAQS